MKIDIEVQHIATTYNEITDEVEIWLFINDRLTKFKKYMRDVK